MVRLYAPAAAEYYTRNTPSMSSSGGRVPIRLEFRSGPPPYYHVAIPSAIYEHAKRPSHIDYIKNTLRIAVAHI